MKLNIFGNQPVFLPRDPVEALEAATKNYVDNGLIAHASNLDIHITASQNTLLDSLTITAAELNLLSTLTGDVQVQLDSKVAIAGSVMTGFLTLTADPTDALHSATKQYVDTADSLKVAKAGDSMTGFLTLNADPTSILHAATKGFVDTSIATHTSDLSVHISAAQNTFIDGITATSTEVNYTVGVTSSIQTQLNSKVAKAGDTMSGLLILSADPAAALGASTKQYSDAQDALKVAKAGDVMTGFLTLSADPTSLLHAATKAYSDSTLLIHTSDAALHITAAQNTLIDAITVTAAEINELASVTSNVQTQLNSKVAKAGDTMTGALVLNADPAVALGAATKQYTDAGDALNVAKAGDTMSGLLVLSADPVAVLGAATKGYSDSTLLIHSSDAALHITASQNTLIDGITTTFTEVNSLTGITSNVQTQIDSKFDKAGGTITGDITLTVGKTVFVDKTPALATELVNKAYVDSLVNGLDWKDPVTEINLVNTTLSAPPGTPVTNDVYIVGATATGAWVGKEGFATFHDGSAWVFLQARAVIAGDRFGVSLTSATVVGASLAALDNDLVTVVVNTPGAITFTADTLTAAATTLVFDPDAPNFGVSFTLTDALSWVPTNTSVNLVPGTGLTLDGSILNTKLGKGIAIDAGSANTPISVDLHANPGLFMTVDGAAVSTLDTAKLSIKLGDTTLTKDASGLFISTTVVAAIADRVSKTVPSSVSTTITVATGGMVKVVDAPVAGDDVTNKTYVDTADTALQGQVTTLQGTVATLNSSPVTLTYVDAQDALKVAKAGDTMTGLLLLSADPTATLGAATKGYSDSTLSTHANNANLHLTAGQNTFIDGITTTFTEVNSLTGITGNVQTQLGTKLPLAGGILTGPLTLSADPAGALNPATKQYTDAGDALKVAKAGDVMTGFLTLSADPTSLLHAATKGYSDSTLLIHSSDAALHITAAQNTLIDGITVTAAEINELSGITSNVQAQIDTKFDIAGGTFTGAITLAAGPIAGLHPATKTYTDAQDALKVAKAGDTMTGLLLLSADPVLNLGAATKQYSDTTLATHTNNTALHITAAQNTLIDAITATSTELNSTVGVTSGIQTQLDAKLNLTGGTLTGALTLSADPVAALGAATKQYSDAQDALKVAKAGDTMTGLLLLSAVPTAVLGAATKGYVDTTDTTQKTYIDAQDTLKVAKVGDTLTGFLVLHADPTLALHAATKQFVDAAGVTITNAFESADTALQGQITTLQSTVNGLNTDPVTKSYVDSQDNTKVNLSGDTLTGFLTLHSDPTSNMHPATKQYVDGVAVGLQTKPSVRFATTVNLDAVYNNGTAGVNATLTGTANGALSVDGKVALVGDRVLVKNQTAGLENGAYLVQQTGDIGTPFIIKRVETINESSEVPGSFFYTFDGLTLKGTGWVITVPNPITYVIGVDLVEVNQFSGQGTTLAGSGLSLTGNTININSVSATRIVVNADNIDLATTGVTPGTFTKMVTDGYGRITSGSNPTTLAGYAIVDGQLLNANLTSLSGVATAGILIRNNSNVIETKAVSIVGTGISVANGNGAAAGGIVITSTSTSTNTANAIVQRDASGNFTANVITSDLVGNASTATALQTARDFSASGDVTAAAVTFDGTGNVDLTTVLSNTGVVAGDYNKVTVDSKGRITAGTNPTTLAGQGIVDGATITLLNAEIAALRAELNDLHLYVMSRI